MTHLTDNAPTGDIEPSQVINPWTNSFELSWKSDSLFSPDMMISIDGRGQEGQITLPLNSPRKRNYTDAILRAFKAGKPFNFFLLDLRFSGKIILTSICELRDNKEFIAHFKTLGPIKSTGNHKIEFETIF